MQPTNDASRNYEVERRLRYAARPGFHIAELQISPTQIVPWHYHSEVQDTFYVQGEQGYQVPVLLILRKIHPISDTWRKR